MIVWVLSCFSHVQLFVTLWTAVHLAALSIGFSRQEYWGRLPYPSPGDLPDSRTEPATSAFVVELFTTSATWEAQSYYHWQAINNAVHLNCCCSLLVLRDNEFVIVLLLIYIHWNLGRCAGEKAMAPHSSTLAWKIPWTEEPGRLQSMGSLRLGHDWATSLSLFTFMHWRRK